MKITIPHQYVERYSGRVVTERLFADRTIRLLYHEVRERAPLLFRLLTSPVASRIIAGVRFDLPFPRGSSPARKLGIDLSECLEPDTLTTPRRLFERRIRYEECRPLPADPHLVVSPADARILVGTLKESTLLPVKGTFFSLEELLGAGSRWTGRFRGGEVAIFRLTPDKYHYNHAPVSGRVVEIFSIDGDHHSCNPSAVVALATPFSRNRRTVTIIDTDVPDGTGVGVVAMVEVVALMIGDIVQCYSEKGYDDPVPVEPGLFIRRGQPKSLYRPGSSTDILLFEPGRIRFSPDLIENQTRGDVVSRFSFGFGRPLVETDLTVRSPIAVRSTP